MLISPLSWLFGFRKKSEVSFHSVCRINTLALHCIKNFGLFSCRWPRIFVANVRFAPSKLAFVIETVKFRNNGIGCREETELHTSLMLGFFSFVFQTQPPTTSPVVCCMQ